MPKPDKHVLVCVNTRPPGNRKGSCGEKGALELFDQLKARVKSSTLGDRVIVNSTSCLKHCSLGITVAVQPDNVWYGRVTGQDIEEICREHLEGGEPVQRLEVPDIPWE